MSCRYVVKDEEALGYIFDKQPTTFGFLSGGAGQEPTSILPGVTKIRPATLADFEKFRVAVPRDFIQNAFSSFNEVSRDAALAHSW